MRSVINNVQVFTPQGMVHKTVIAYSRGGKLSPIQQFIIDGSGRILSPLEQRLVGWEIDFLNFMFRYRFKGIGEMLLRPTLLDMIFKDNQFSGSRLPIP